MTEKIHDPIHRVAYSFSRDGEGLWISTWLEDGGHLPEHFHPSLEERWEVLEGKAMVKLDGSWRELAPEHGPVVVARNVRHELKNVSGREARLRTEVLPAGRSCAPHRLPSSASSCPWSRASRADRRRLAGPRQGD